MAKRIYMTSTDVESICAELRNTLSGLKCYGSIDIKRSFKSDDRVAMLYFTPIAWIPIGAELNMTPHCRGDTIAEVIATLLMVGKPRISA